MIRYFLAIAIFLLFTTVSAQEQMGITFDNYSPTQSVFLNPSSIVDNGAFLDVNLVSAGVFFDNDLLFLSKNDFKLTRGQSQFEGDIMPLQHSGNHRRHGYVSSMVQGPSLSVVLGRWSIGLHTAARAEVDFRNISSELSNFIFEGLSYDPQQDLTHKEENARVNGMAWAEAGVTIGGIMVKRGNHLLSAAVTPRRLYGIGAGGVVVDHLEFQVGDSAYLNLDELSAQGGYTEQPGWNTGRGWGLNAGITYKRMKEDVGNYTPHSTQSGCELPEYRYKIGLSLLDLGAINFDRGTQHYQITELELNAANYNEDLPGSVEEVDSLFNADVMGQLSENGSMRMSMPTALSLQFDLNIGHNFYASAAWVHGFGRRQSMGVQRAALLNVTPRFEHERVAISLPITLYQYNYPRIGLAFRVNSFYVGTDRLGSLLFNPDFYGADIYFGVRYTMFKRKGCRGRKVPKPKLTADKIVACPTWD